MVCWWEMIVAFRHHYIVVHFGVFVVSVVLFTGNPASRRTGDCL